MQVLDIKTGRCIKVNQQLCNITGYSNDEYISSSFFTHELWLDEEQKINAYSKLRKEKKLSNIEAEIRSKNGNIVTVIFNVEMLEDVGEDIALISITNVSENKEIIKAIKQAASSVSVNEQDKFYHQIIQQIVKTFMADTVLITQLNENVQSAVDTLSYYQDGKFESNISFVIENTPCEVVFNNQALYFSNNIQHLFSANVLFLSKNIEAYIGLPLYDLNNNVTGSLILLFKSKVYLSEYQKDVLQIFAAKISSEFKYRESISQFKLSEQKLKLYQEQAPLASIEWDADFKLISWNKAAEKMLGYSLSEIKKINFIDMIVPKAEQAKMQEFCDLLISGKGGQHSINDVITKQGERITTEWHNKVIYNELNEIVGYTSIFRDITAEKESYRLLAAKERETKEILDTMYDAVFTVNELGNVLSFNKAAEEMFGYSSDEIINQNITLLMPKSIANKHDPYFQSFLKNSENPTSNLGQDVVAIRKNNEEFPMRLSVAELSSDIHGHHRFIGTCQDLTELKKQQTLMNRFQKMDALGKLTGGIAHDFNNILGVISGYAELLNRKLNQEPDLFKYSEQIIKASTRGADLTSKLLSFSSKKSINAGNININDLILSSKDLLLKTLTASILINFELNETLWNTKLDVNAFEDSLLNLAINAKYAMPEGGHLIIKTSNEVLSPYMANKYKISAGEYVCLNIKDSGYGMNSEVLQHLFEPFFTTKGDDGTGLGLAQVYGFMQASNGGIDVDSIVELGTSFKLYFPRVSNAIAQKTLDVEIQENSNCSGTETILVVDDEFSLTQIAKEFLVNEGYKVYTVASAKEALILLKEKPIDLLISDIIMPKMSGYDLAEQVQILLPELPIIFVSGFIGNEEKHNKFLFIPLVRKPYSSVELLKNTRDALDKNITNKTVISVHEMKEISSLLLSMSEKPFSEPFKFEYSDLFEQINHFNKINSEQITNNHLVTLKNNLVILLQKHFEREDIIMMDSYYPYAKNHIAVHALFIKELNRINPNHNKSTMVKWIKESFLGGYTEHVNSMDIAFEEFIVKNEKLKDEQS